MKKRPVRERGRENSIKLPEKVFASHQSWYQTQRGIRKQSQDCVEEKRKDVDGKHTASGHR
jgi:hypothetical protein